MNAQQARENFIECIVSSRIDKIDRAYMRDTNTMSESEYKAAIKAVDAWAEEQYRKVQS